MKVLKEALLKSISLLRIIADFLFPDICIICRKPLQSGVCRECVRNFSSVFFHENIIYISDYNEKARKIVHLFKYHQNKRARIFFENSLVSAVSKIQYIPDYIVAVPVFNKKNHMDDVAVKIADALNKPVFSAVSRNRYTKPQYLLNPSERSSNVDGCFSVKKNGLLHKKILFIDDIYTTGATMNALADEFEKSGIETWKALVFARACPKTEEKRRK